ncbi:MAG: aminotransferase class V-fold PLP-dependent enzyme [Clostridia bacterium]|nr:aminotransferase class V-fold PLP-dependent enzyme [Clostridia bacterium]
MIYLDNAATTFPKPNEVTDALTAYMTSCGASPGRGGYDSSIRSAEMLFECQEEIARLLSIPSPERIVFTKNATEALNAAIFGTVDAGDEIIISSMEHNAVMRAAHECSRRGVYVKIAHGSPTGKIAPESIKNLITDKTKLICLIHSSNVCGTINDIYSVQKIATESNTLALFDLSQSAGIIPIDASGLDMVAFSGHKGLMGPMGTGCLYIREGIDPSPLLFGGTGSYSESARMPLIYPDRFHAGTVNAPGIAALCEGVRFVLREGVFEKEKEITSYMYDALSDISGVTVPGERERTNAISVICPHHDCVHIAEELNISQVCVRAGLHCAPMAHRTIGTIQSGTIRFSAGFFTEKPDVDFALSALKKIIGK